MRVKSKNISCKTQYVMSTGNPELYKFIQESKRELEQTVEHRRGIIKGYQLINLDSLYKEGKITESERKAGSRSIEKICGMIQDHGSALGSSAPSVLGEGSRGRAVMQKPEV